MAIYYSRLSTLSRSRGQSAVAAAAYRCGGKLKDERLERTHDYRRKGGVLDARMLAPADASWALDTSTLWNRAEKAEVRCNARTARELIVALPAELPQAAQIELAHTIGQDLVEQYRVAVLVAVHAPDKAGDDRNVHAHLMMTTREVRADGLGPKTRVLDDKTTGPAEAERMRENVAARINAALEHAGIATTVDPRPLTVQAEEAAERGDLDAVVRLTRTPTRHQGVSATGAARKGHFSPVVHENRNVQRDNRSVARHGRKLANRYRTDAHSRVRGPEDTSNGPSRARPRPTTSTRVSGTTGSRHASRTRDPVELYMQAIQADARQLELTLSEQLRSVRDQAAEYAQLAELWRQGRANRYRDDRTSALLHSVAQATRVDRSHSDRAVHPQSARSCLDRTDVSEQRGLTRRQWAEYRRGLRRLELNPIESLQRGVDESNLYGRQESGRVTGVQGGRPAPFDSLLDEPASVAPNRVTARLAPGRRPAFKPRIPAPRPGRRRCAP
ncbi:MAG: MobA/MobL family protein [Rhodanobacteraceae bacterium]|nr:MobA/MobL family protein [Rhodanobacteraceae bacterium]